MNADKGGENKKIGSTAETLRTLRKNIEDRFAKKPTVAAKLAKYGA